MKRILLGNMAALAAAMGVGILVAGCAGRTEPLAAAPPSPIAAPAVVLPAEVRERMDSVVEAGIADGRMPGAVLLVGAGDQVAYLNSYGNRSLEPNVPMTPDTVFDLASVSKVVGTATAAMLLIEDGKMTLETRVADLIPDFSAGDKGNVTIRDLMTHTSGLKAYENWQTAEAIRGDGEKSDALIRRIASLDKSYKTGERTVYSCLNFLTLARVNEIVAGESMESLLSRRVWKPLGMKDTSYIPRPDMIARWAPTFKGALPASRTPASTHDPLAFYYGSSTQHCPGNAGLFSTAPDLAQWCRMIANEGEVDGVRIFKPETIRLWTSVQAHVPAHSANNPEGGNPIKRALGFQVSRDMHPDGPSESWINHTGYTGTYFFIDKSKKSFVLLLANAVYSQDPPQMGPPRTGVARALVRYQYGSDSPEE